MFDDLSIKEAAAHVGLTEPAFRKLCAKGDGPTCRRNGRTMHFLKDHLDAWKTEFIAKAYSEPSVKASPTGKKAAKVPGTGKKAA